MSGSLIRITEKNTEKANKILKHQESETGLKKSKTNFINELLTPLLDKMLPGNDDPYNMGDPS